MEAHNVSFNITEWLKGSDENSAQVSSAFQTLLLYTQVSSFHVSLNHIYSFSAHCNTKNNKTLSK